MTDKLDKLLAFLNPGSGSAEQMQALLAEQPNIQVRQLEVPALKKALKEAADRGVRRIIVSGGDGTVALAAHCLAGTATELAVLPGGTLNHFTDRVGIPADASDALQLALQGEARPVDVGFVNDHLFINTCSAGAYVTFVRSREYLERRMSYHLASLLAGIRRLFKLRSIKIELDGHPVRTPLVFVGVGERELQFPMLGQARPEGKGGLHVIALRSRNRVDTLRVAFNAIFRGIDPLTKQCQIDQQLVDAIEINPKRKKAVQIAVDGEIIQMSPPLKFRYEPDLVRVVVPEHYRVNPPG
ncbi:MAG: diacylglycerol kinase family protein [Chromatiales bacterium]